MAATEVHRFCLGRTIVSGFCEVLMMGQGCGIVSDGDMGWF